VDENGVPYFDGNLFLRQIYRAVMHGARVINISLGAGGPNLSNTHTAPQDRVRAKFGHDVRQAIRDASASSGHPHPLVVIGAGNDVGTNVYWNYVTAIADSLPTESIVVAAMDSTTSHGIWSGSNTGSLVSIAAPGVNVGASNGTTLSFETGTSIATAYVSGTAALVFSFDPSLSAATVKQHIINGAIKGKRVVAYRGGSYPLLNAYESLELAAKRSGAPLCGNQRVWIENHNVYVARDSGTTPELLGAIGSDAWGLDVYHGGKWIDYQTASGFGHFTFDGVHWVATTDWDSVDLVGGSYSSSQGITHEGTNGIGFTLDGSYWNNNVPVGTERVTVYVTDSLGAYATTTVDVPTGDSSHMRQTRRITRAYPQRGDTAYFALTRMRSDITYHGYECFDDRGIQTVCYFPTVTDKPDTSFLYRVNVRGGPPVAQLVRALPDTLVYSMSLSEDDRSSVLVLGSEQDLRDEGGLRTHNWCQVRYLDGRFGGTPQRTIVTSDACPYLDEFDASGGGFSANRVPAHSSMGRLLNRIPPVLRARPIRNSSLKSDSHIVRP
jgi:hypothetical protein